MFALRLVIWGTVCYHAKMGWFEEIRKALGSASVPPGKPDTRILYFSRNFQTIAKQRGLTEKDATDVYYHGSVMKPNMMVRKYNGYEIGIYYFVTADTGQTIIASIWKRDRR